MDKSWSQTIKNRLIENNFLLIILFLFIPLLTQSQNKKIDSLFALVKTDKEDTNKVIHLYKICGQYININEYEKGIANAKKGIALAENLNYKKGIAAGYNYIGIIYDYQDNYPEALKMYFKNVEIRREIKDKKGIGIALNNIGLIYWQQGNYPEALRAYFESLKIMEEVKYKLGIADCYVNIGNIYGKLNNYPEALKNYNAALKIRKEINDKQGIASSYNNIGIIYDYQGNFAEALKNQFMALNIFEEIGDKTGVAYSYQDIGNIYLSTGDFSASLKNHLCGLKIQEELGNRSAIAYSFLNLGDLYTKQKKIKESHNYLIKALYLGREIGSKDVIKQAYANLLILDSLQGNYRDAFENHKLYIIYRDSIDNEETQKKSLQASMQYEFDKKEIAAKAEQEKLDAVTKEEKQKQQIVIYSVAGVLVLVVIFSLFLFSRFRITQRQKTVIEEQKVLVDKAYETLHEKNKEVMDSIHYARRIQNALITSEKYIAYQLNRLMKNN